MSAISATSGDTMPRLAYMVHRNLRRSVYSGTFVPKILRSIIEERARWTEDDLKWLKLLG
jgi:hypothetical protein